MSDPPRGSRIVTRVRAIVRPPSRRLTRGRIARIRVEGRFRSREILDRIGAAYLTLDTNWTFTYINPGAERLLGRSWPEIVGRGMWEVYPDITATPLGDGCRRAMRDGETVMLENFYPPFNAWFEIRIFPDPTGLTVFFRNVSARRQAELRLELSERRYRELVESVPAVIYSQGMTAGNPVLYISPFVEELLGDPPSAFVADHSLWSRRVHPDDYAGARRSDQHSKATGDPFTAEYRMIARDGQVVWVLDEAIPVRDEMGTMVAWQGIVRDISTRRAEVDHLRRLAHRDALTGLANRAFLDERLTSLLGSEPIGAVAVLFIDLDRFKLVNDAYGHDAGDLVLATMAQRLSVSLGAVGLLARFGGDEFVAVLGGTTPADATTVADGLCRVLRRPVAISGREVIVGGSIGVAMNRTRPQTGTDLIREASLAIRAAKGAGRNRVTVFEPGLDRAGDQLTLIADLRGAIRERQFRLHYQPVVDIATGDVVTVEALLRWDHPRRGLLTPAVFMTLAEETGLIAPIGSLVIEEAIRQLADWDATLGPLAPPEINVNIAARQLHDHGLPDRIGEALARRGIAPGRFRLEISERTADDDLVASEGVIGALHARGLPLSLDDFGAGISSLAHLRAFAATDLKLDQVFVRQLADDPRTATVIRGIADLARALDIVVTVEGIETAEQFAIARAAGCDRVQGWLVAEAMPPEALAGWLAGWATDRPAPFARPSRGTVEAGLSRVHLLYAAGDGQG